ncbi:deoxyinosine 3'endonuclease (endonuclease V) [Caldisphaera lagunensis DSM 15908]|uniref:Endonuclease V n=1 Tax=Caldisphaera lagunensis (strain DSM 15908 / JCM 11604 / ANMR 0165 / IC-154) TaxID=1056495 RepID=L0AAX2_CALLD|nr:endonuclease V [Caldisphaera lagunensis]AFZ70277.1 deoxyinosine 3'endonuclease (endonuclease V) [Caldisphaera lagunensis DSM 15908]
MIKDDNNCVGIRENFNVSIAINDQILFSKKINLNDFINIRDIENKVIAAVDASYTKNDLGIGVAIAFEYPSYNIIDCELIARKVCIPYIPGLLAFREMYLISTPLLKLLKKVKPQVLFVDGHGYAHPRFAGIATHIGIVFDIPTIGIAKKKLVGEEVVENNELYLRFKDRLVSKILLINNKKIYVSPGNKISLENSFNITKLMIGKFNLPIPIYLADKLSKIAKRNLEVSYLDSSNIFSINNNLSNLCKKLINKIK